MKFYHVTTEDRLENILKVGLQPNSPSNRSARPAPFIMFSKYPAWNLYKNWKKDKGNILLEVDIPLTAQMLEDMESDPEGIMCENHITPEHIKSVVKFEILK